MVKLNVVGRAVRVFDQWYCLQPPRCEHEGAPTNRFHGELCCLRCDPAMLGLDAPLPSRQGQAVARESETQLRAVESPGRHRGREQNCPPRSALYTTARIITKVGSQPRIDLPTRVILSHICHNAVRSSEQSSARNGNRTC